MTKMNRPLLLAPAAAPPRRLLAAAARTPGSAGPIPKAPVILISIDTLRSDHLPAYGYKGVETPAIDALRAGRVLFERAYCHYAADPPVAHLAAHRPAAGRARGARQRRLHAIDGERASPFLPEILKKAGYATGGAVSAYVLRRGDRLSTRASTSTTTASRSAPATGLGGLQRPGRRDAPTPSLDWAAAR